MQITKQHALFLTLLLAMTLIMVMHAAAQQPAQPTEKILVNFTSNQSPANSPSGGLISDAAGNLYGITTKGGKGNGGLGYGTVYELSPTAGGGWKAKSLYQFQAGTDGESPVGGLVMDSSGNLYGTTQYGGTHVCSDNYDKFSCGTVFELSPNGAGGWSEKVIYNFSQKVGYGPTSSLVMDSSGNLFGTTAGDYSGTVFELRRSGTGWTERVLHYFGAAGDGMEPDSPLIFDAAGNLYGETFIGGQSGGGTVFELAKTATGWEEQILFSFDTDGTGASGLEPLGGLVLDSAGNLYGTTIFGGFGNGYGTVFQLKPASSGTWNETVLYNFQPDQYNRCNPGAGLVMDSAGNLYGTTSFGGSDSGTLFELKSSGNGTWAYTLLYSFGSYSTDGLIPNSNLLLDAKGNLFGTTGWGGSGQGGTVFEITP